ncbi:MAG: trimeric intracellular cation channel family protein [Lewinellaceae bacterium]|nr:trimeric intracellular cation channel family protein [Lewinellaceae bacterium]MCB9355845.1 trimeric intracellular cation channel family protein [Lewinellaceae bacterium]
MLFREIMEMLGTASFAISGALAAMNKRLDIFGVLVITFATAVGGGTIRDVMIGNTPVSWLKDRQAITVIFVSYLLTLVLRPYLRHFNRPLAVFDAVGLGFATIVGLQKGLEAQLGPAICVTLGMVSGCFGGVVRDVLLNEIPLIFRKDIYASASMLGGVLYLVFAGWDMFAPLAATLSIFSVVGLRLAVLRYGWEFPGIRVPDQ